LPSWAKTEGVVRMTMPGQPEIEIRLDEGRDNCRLCGIGVIENDGGALNLRRHLGYHCGQKQFADDVDIILRWAAGSKD
jgi:tellurite resistance protein TerA